MFLECIFPHPCLYFTTRSRDMHRTKVCILSLDFQYGMQRESNGHGGLSPIDVHDVLLPYAE